MNPVDDFCDDVARALRDMHIPDATQAVTKAGVGFGYLIIDCGTIMCAELEGPKLDLTETCVVCLVKSAELSMLDWQRRLFLQYCHVVMDLDPSTQDLLVEPHDGLYDQLEQALDDHFDEQDRAATVLQTLVRNFLHKPIDLT